MTENQLAKNLELPRVSRRSLLGSAVVGGALLLTGSTAAESDPHSDPSAKTEESSAPVAFPAPFLRLFEEDGLNFEALLGLGSAGISSEIGETLTAVREANELGGDVGAFFTAYSNLAARTAKSASGKGEVTARARHLRAAKYYAQALFMVYGSATPSAEEQIYKAMNDSWTIAAALATPAWQKVAIPYEGSHLPGWLLTPPGPVVRRPTVIITNGSDGQNADVLSYGPLAAVERGYNALLYDGPGQGEMLFVRGIPFRPDWEKVVTPIVDYLLERPEVDPKRIALTGWSMGGALVARAAAFEPRLAAVVSDSGLYNPWLGFHQGIREIANAGDMATVNGIWAEEVLPNVTPSERFTIAKRFSIFSTEALAAARSGRLFTDFFTMSQIVQSFDIHEIMGRITRPYLVTDYEAEGFYAGQAKVLFDAIAGPKDYHLFTGGALYHCAPLAPATRNEVVFDWLDRTLNVNTS